MAPRMRYRSRPLSHFIEPCLPRAAAEPPAGQGWLHEIKHDGFRIMARRDGRGVRLFTRNGYCRSEPQGSSSRSEPMGVPPPWRSAKHLIPPSQGGPGRADVETRQQASSAAAPLRCPFVPSHRSMRVVWAPLLKRYELQWDVLRPNLPTRR
jgi:hypothetical protein